MKQMLLVFIIIGFANIVAAKSYGNYQVISTEGKPVEISFRDSKFTDRELVVSCPHDSLFFYEFRGVDQVKLLDKNFLQVVYRTRGGSGVTLKYLIILSVTNHKINVCFQACCYTYIVDVQEERLCRLFDIKIQHQGNQLVLIANSQDQFRYVKNKSVIVITDTVNLKPKANYNTFKKITFQFDSDKHIFYNSYRKIKRLKLSQSPDYKDAKTQFISGTFPVLILNKQYHYYIQGHWFWTDVSDWNLLQTDYFRYSMHEILTMSNE